jgi:hypothetical protein
LVGVSGASLASATLIEVLKERGVSRQILGTRTSLGETTVIGLRARGSLVLVATILSLVAPGVGKAAECHWTAPPFAKVLDNTRLPNLHAKADFGSDAAPAVVPTPGPYVWNPVFPIDQGGRVHERSDGVVSSIITISGGGCAPAHVAVLVYGDGFVPQRGLAVSYGHASASDELNAGGGDFTTVTAHGEIEAPFRLRKVWFSGDVRSIGYTHVAGLVTDVGATSRTFRPTFSARDNSLELRSGYALERGGPVLELAYLNAATNAYRPSVNGLGVAVEVPPELDETFSAYGSLSYYPSLVGGGIAYSATRYRIGGALSLAPAFGHPYYFELSLLGDRRTNRSRAPSSASYSGIMLGIGYRFGGIP